MALHESTAESFPNLNTVFQFNRRTAAAKYRYTSNFGGPDGWGIMQIDKSFGTDEICDAHTTDNPNPVKTEWVWHWQLNVEEGVRIAAQKLDEIKNSINLLRNYYQNSGNGNWVEPPMTIPDLPADLPAIDTVLGCAVQRYNGSSKAINVGSEIKKVYAPFCMEFDQATSV